MDALIKDIKTAIDTVRTKYHNPNMISIKMHPETITTIKKEASIVGPYWPTPEAIFGIEVFSDTSVPIGRAKITYEVEI